MKFLVLAICVCAASAASFPAFKPQVFASASVSSQAKPSYNVQVESKPDVSAVSRVRTVDESKVAYILKSESDVHPEGYSYSYETSDGTAANAQGVVKNVDNVATLVVEGQFRYVAPDGTPVQVNYVANENGYQPDSSVLPKDHPIPEYILRSLEYIRTHAPKEDAVRKF